MKNYIMITLVALHLISASLFATNTFVQKHHYTHQHSHIHSGSIYQHKHTHAQANINIADFFIPTDKSNKIVILYSKESHAETKFFISDPTLESLFRPPIV